MKQTLATILLSALSLGGVQAQTKLQHAQTDTLLSYYNQLLEFNGSALLVRDKKEIFNKGYGYRIVDKQMVCDSNTLFQVGPVTQSITATLILMLHEQGKLNINDKLSKYYPDYPYGDKITVEHLLNHTSGIYDYMDSSDFYQNGVLTPKDETTMVSLFKDKPLTSVPGKEFNYSTSNYLLLGYIAEKATGKTYYELVRELIFKPLGMKQSGFGFGQFPSWDKAQGHYIMRYARLTPAPVVDSSTIGAAGAMFSSVNDLRKFGQAVLDHKLLNDTTWKRVMNSKAPFAYGWYMVDDSISGQHYMGQHGGMHGFMTEYRLVPKDKTIIIVLSNDSGDDLDPVLDKISAILYSKPFEWPTQKQPLPWAEEKLREYEGMYELNESTDLRVYYEQGILKGIIIGADPFYMYPMATDKFYVGNVDVTIRFERNDEGKIARMIIKQQGQEQVARKWR